MQVTKLVTYQQRTRRPSRFTQTAAVADVKAAFLWRRADSRISTCQDCLDRPACHEDVNPAATPARDAVYFCRIINAREALTAAEQELRDAVHAAREAGDSWTVIGAALTRADRLPSKGSVTTDLRVD